MTTDRPTSLELVRAFANTVDVEHGEDELERPGGAWAWLVSHDLLNPSSPPLTRDEADLVVATRDGIRSLIGATHDPELDPRWSAGLERAVEVSGVRPVFAPNGVTIVPSADGAAGAVGRLLGHVHDAMTDGSWDRLKLCANDACRWAFHDRSRNRSGRWCDMAVCGNRAKVRAYRERAEP